MRIPVLLTAIVLTGNLLAQTAMINIDNRNTTSLNGSWQVILDPTGAGDYRQVWQERKAQSKTEFVEYSFDGGPYLQVPGDFNSQRCDLTNLEGTVWYKKPFTHVAREGKRTFVYFGAVNHKADVYLNGEKLGSHEGGFTPFQFELTGKVTNGTNTLIVRANNSRQGNALPGYGYDWFNYGGITRDVYLVETSQTFIHDYFIQLKKGSLNSVEGWVKLNGNNLSQEVVVEIPELKLKHRSKTDATGKAKLEFKSNFELWSPTQPKLYTVVISSETDQVTDEIGFRCIEVEGNKVLLNKQPLFLKAVNMHEENPYKAARAFSSGDNQILLNAAKDLGCNLLRLSHYPYNEKMIKQAEKMGMMVWSELPIYQHIEFSDSTVPCKMETMLNEMLTRDKNRCGVVVWSLSNETYPDTPNRNKALIDLTQKCKALDSTRLIVHVINTQGYSNNTFNVWDPLYNYSDLIALNEYIGWYIPWKGKPSETNWNIAFPDKPVFISEFGGEALYGSKGPTDEAAYWTEEYQANIYKDQIEMFTTIPNLCGVCPWLLFDYRSLGRMNQLYQNGYNRKGLLSEKGQKKKAWYVMNEYFNEN
ncbi:glycoside hydrolase family 2 protein [Roseimarinus sediminis]|uniref:glycoside hydrolase family 2 protein n=1 Tax=Roseimarinus sediminis TaxID=1610899 RepID=UPI003D1BB7C1